MVFFVINCLIKNFKWLFGCVGIGYVKVLFVNCVIVMVVGEFG